MAKNGRAHPMYVNSDTFATALGQIGEIHGQMPAIQERLAKVEAWQARYGNRWGVFFLGIAVAINTIWDIIFRLGPIASKAVHLFLK